MTSKISRRNFLKFGLSSGLGLGLASGAYAISSLDTHKVEVVETKIHLPDLPPAFRDYRIAFLSDIHLGSCESSEWIREVFELAAKTKPDLLLLGGDFIWVADAIISQASLSMESSKLCFSQDESDAGVIYPLVASIIQTLNAPDGAFAVFGNHDRWVAPDICMSSLGERGIKTLINEVVKINRGTDQLTLVGCDDYWTGIPSIPKLPPRTRGQELRILFTHNPDFISETLDRTDFEFDLGLAGHTHGGQIKLPGIGALFYNIKDKRFAEGLVQHPKAQVYTSRGIGVVGLPVRINCPPEVSLLTLHAA